MNFLNPDEKTRIKIRKAEPPKPASAPGTVPGKGLVAGAKAGTGAPGAAKSGAAAPAGKPASALAATVKAKLPPKVQVLQVEPGVFEVHFSCSCGEEYIIRCDSAEKSSPPSAS